MQGRTVGNGLANCREGISVCTIDLRGHGQHANLLDQGIVSDVNAAITYCRRFGKVTAVGHSLGGRIALVSDADYVIGISPAIAGRFGPPARDNLKSLRAYKVRYNTSEDFLNIFQTVPEWNVSKNKPILILYGTRDIPGIVEACRKINGTYMVVTHEIEDALHTDIYLNEETYRIINKQLRRWSEYKQLNSQV